MLGVFVCIGGIHLFLRLANFEDILQPLQRNSDNSCVWAGEEVTERLDAVLGNQVLDLVVGAAGCGVRDGPGCFLLDFELSILEVGDKRRDDARVYHCLNLILVPGSDIGDGPARLFLDALLVTRK